VLQLIVTLGTTALLDERTRAERASTRLRRKVADLGIEVGRTEEILVEDAASGLVPSVSSWRVVDPASQLISSATPTRHPYEVAREEDPLGRRRREQLVGQRPQAGQFIPSSRAALRPRG
jgi:hypothetical protein